MGFKQTSPDGGGRWVHSTYNTFIYIYICVYIYICIYIYVYMYIYLHIDAPKKMASYVIPIPRGPFFALCFAQTWLKVTAEVPPTIQNHLWNFVEFGHLRSLWRIQICLSLRTNISWALDSFENNQTVSTFLVRHNRGWILPGISPIMFSSRGQHMTAPPSPNMVFFWAVKSRQLSPDAARISSRLVVGKECLLLVIPWKKTPSNRHGNRHRLAKLPSPWKNHHGKIAKHYHEKNPQQVKYDQEGKPRRKNTTVLQDIPALRLPPPLLRCRLRPGGPATGQHAVTAGPWRVGGID